MKKTVTILATLLLLSVGVASAFEVTGHSTAQAAAKSPYTEDEDPIDTPTSHGGGGSHCSHYEMILSPQGAITPTCIEEMPEAEPVCRYWMAGPSFC